MKKQIKINEPLLDSLTQRGKEINNILNSHKIFSVNIMASPGAGKTSLIMNVVNDLKKNYRIAVIEGDIVPIDVEKIRSLGIPVVLAHTGGSCHLDSIMMENALKELNLKDIDILIVENVGNLICPASFYLGTHKNIVIASVPEGDDKPYKYPAMFRGADLVLLNKIDYLDKESFDVQSFRKAIHLQNSGSLLLEVSCKTKENISTFIDWIKENYSLL